MAKLTQEQNKINEFITWYQKDAIHYSTTEIGQYYPTINMFSLINKITVWYELKYNADVINKKDNKNIAVFTNKQLLNSLPWYERFYFLPTRYINIVKISIQNTSINIHLDDSGNIIPCEENRFVPKDLLGLHIKDALTIITASDANVKTNTINQAINNYAIQEEIKKRLMESIAYNIIASDTENGLKRAFMFIKDFKLNPSLLLAYDMSNNHYLLEEIERYQETYNEEQSKKLAKTN